MFQMFCLNINFAIQQFFISLTIKIYYFYILYYYIVQPDTFLSTIFST